MRKGWERGEQEQEGAACAQLVVIIGKQSKVVFVCFFK